MASCRICDEATTSSRSRSRWLGAWRSRSTSLPWRSDARPCPDFTMPQTDQMQQRQVDHATVYRWVLRFTPLLTEAARPCRHAVGDLWVPDIRFMSCELRVLMDKPTDS